MGKPVAFRSFMTLQLFVYRDGEEGCEHPCLLEALVDPQVIQSVHKFKIELKFGVSRALHDSPAFRARWVEHGESMTLMEIDAAGLLTWLCGYCSGIASMTMTYLERSSLDLDEDLAEGFAPSPEETKVE